MTVVELQLSERDGAVRFLVRAKPRASKSRVTGVIEGALSVALAAPPVDGEANEELVRVLAKALGVKRSAVTVAVGAAGRQKLVDVRGVDAAYVRHHLAEACSLKPVA